MQATIDGHPNVLVVDDSASNLKLLERMLTQLGCRFSLAESGKIALQLLRNFDFDLILMDCMMPDMDGYETTLLIRDPEVRVKNRGIPIIALTANISQENRKKCICTGMNDFLEKPVNMQRLASIIRTWSPKELEKSKVKSGVCNANKIV